MSLRVPSLSAIRAGNDEAIQKGIEFLGMSHQHLRNADVARAVFERGGQYNDFVNSYRKTLDRMFTHGWARSLGQLANAYGYVKNGRVSESEWREDVQRRGEGIKKNIIEQQKWIQQSIVPMIEAGYIEPGWVDNYNGYIKQALEYYPELQKEGVDFLSGGNGNLPSAEDFVNQVTGVKSLSGLSESFGREEEESVRPTNTSTDPNTYTGWMKNVYEKAVGGSGNALDYAPGFVLSNPHYRATLEYVQQAVDGTLENTAVNNEINQAQASGGTQSAGGAGSIDEQFIQGQADALQYIQDSDLPADLKALYSTIVQNWDPNQSINFSSIESAFDEVTQETIDPYIQGLANLAKQQLNVARSNLETQRGLQVESEGIRADQNLRNERQRLEQSGLTFTGEAVRTLGTQSAFARDGQTDTQLPTIGDVEGLIPAEARIISTASAADYQKNLSDLALQAEEILGTEGAAAEGFDTVGSVTGNIPQTQQSLEANALGNLISQSALNVQQDELLDVIS